MIDSHCHLVCTDFSQDLEAVIARAFTVGVTDIVTISDEISDVHSGLEIAKKYEHIFCTAGVHPHHAKDVDLARDLSILREAAKHPKCVAIGEIGLDYHYMHSPKEVQQRVFEAQLILAKELDMPAVVHCRDAVEDLYAIVNHVRPAKLVIHCCTEKWKDVVKFVEAGYLLSFTGIVTYPKSDDVRETVKQCPLESLMVETDAPYLAPVPYRGKRCEPAFVIETAKMIAEMKDIPLEEFDRITTATTVEFFGLPS